MKTQKVLICGASGFIGQNIFAHFTKDDRYETFGTYFETPSSLPFVEINKEKLSRVDLTDKNTVNAIVQGKDIIIQAAATTSGAKEILSKPFYHVTDNAVMNSLLLRACYEHAVKQVVFFSCTVMYPQQPRPVKEGDFNYEITEKYFGVGWTKVYIEKMCEFYSRLGRTRFTVVRHSNIYGPHDKYDLEKSHVFGATVAKVMSADEKVIVWGEGTEKRDLLYVDDLVSFVDAALSSSTESFELMNVGSGYGISVKELVEKIIAASGKDLRIEFDTSKPTIPFTLAVNIEKAKRRFSWAPKVSLDEGIRKSLAWYRANHLKNQPI